MNPEQAARLSAILATCDVASAQSVVQRVKGLFGVKFSLSGMTDWLKRNDFSFKKGGPAPAKADPQAQLEFSDTHRTLKDSLPEGEALLFLDAAHPTMATKLGYGWSIKAECVNDFATPCVINLLCRVVLFQSVSFALVVG